jgi:hypothetical protein
MGDEQKIKNIMKRIDDINIILDKTEIKKEAHDQINEKYDEIKGIYKDFMDNYLDFIEISDNLYDGIYITDGNG